MRSKVLFNIIIELRSITLQNTINQLYDYAFAGCTALTSFTVTSNISSIGNYVFDGCTALEKIDVVKENSSFISIDGVLFNKAKTELLMIPYGFSGSYSICP